MNEIISHQLSFAKNSCVQILFGRCNENILYIENELKITINTNGNVAKLVGNKKSVAQAKDTLQILYGRILVGETIGLADVKGALKNNSKNESRIFTKKKKIYARTKSQEIYIDAMLGAELIFGIGAAGTGKTYLAVAYASMLLEKNMVEKIILTRPAVEAGEQLGFLPGDMKEKVDPYLRPLYDSLYDMFDVKKIEKYILEGKIEIAPLAFMRGRTLTNAAIILDEAQNTSPMQMKMFLTRLGEGSKMIINGDPSQIDLPENSVSGLTHSLDVLAKTREIKIIRFNEKDVVRHGLVAKIVKAYNKATKEN